MAENLAYMPDVFNSYNDRGQDLLYFVYDYEGTDVQEARLLYNYQTYGTLYNYDAAMKACPSGWHLTSDDEWKMLERKLGMDVNELDENTPNERNSGEVGYQLKSISGWSNNGNGSNSSGFNAIPGGGLFGTYLNIDQGAAFWTSTLQREAGVFRWSWYRAVSSPHTGVQRYWASANEGFSVRCVR